MNRIPLHVKWLATVMPGNYATDRENHPQLARFVIRNS